MPRITHLGQKLLDETPDHLLEDDLEVRGNSDSLVIRDSNMASIYGIEIFGYDTKSDSMPVPGFVRDRNSDSIFGSEIVAYNPATDKSLPVTGPVHDSRLDSNVETDPTKTYKP